MGCRHAEQCPQQGGFVQRMHLQHVARDGCFDERVRDVTGPLGFIVRDGGGAGIASKIEPLIKVPAKGARTFGIGPMHAAMEQEPASQAFAHAPMKQQRRRSEKKHGQRKLVTAVFVPEPLDGFAPAANLLDFVQNQQPARSGQCASPHPLGFNPFRPGGRKIIGGFKHRGPAQCVLDIHGRSGFTNLPGARHDLDEGRPVTKGPDQF